MAFYKYFRRVNKDEDDKKLPVLPLPKEIKMANEAVANAMESSKSDRGKYNTYSKEKRAQIGCLTKAAAHFSTVEDPNQ